MSQIPFEDETLDASDGVTKLLLAAEYWKKKALALRAELDALKAWKEEVEKQEPVAWMKEQWSPDCGSYWELYREDEMGWRDRKDWTPLYARPVPERIPRESIEKILNEAMDIAVKNGANSISMPDEFVEVAAWLCDIPASVSDDTVRINFIEQKGLEISADGAWSEEPRFSVVSVNGGRNDREWVTLGKGETLREAIDAAMLAAAPKPEETK